ncbi:MAG: SDR family NAD(P)-dependent oxidoreductase [Steroidobacteraceae bacterium]
MEQPTVGKLNNKVAIVTGASRGIGKEVAKVFAREGAKVVACSRTLEEGGHLLPGSLNRTAEEIAAFGGSCLAVQGDVSSEEDCQRIVRSAQGAFGPVDILINNAMWTDFKPIVDMSVKRWARSFAVNVQGPFMLSKLVLPGMIEKHGGHIVNISSNSAIGPGRGPYGAPEAHWWGTEGVTSNIMYGATKAALERFTQGLAEEVYPHGISVACVSPGVGVATEGNLYFKLFDSPDDPRSEPISLMADSILLLATEPPDRITGRVTYSQAILKEFGWIQNARGFGVDEAGSGFSQI